MRLCRYIQPDTKFPALGAVGEDGLVYPLGTPDDLGFDIDEWLSRPDAKEFAREAVTRALEGEPFAPLEPFPHRKADQTGTLGQVQPFSVKFGVESQTIMESEGPGSAKPMEPVRFYSLGAPFLHPLAPLQSQEVWACGVTYERSKVARMEESAGGGDFYDLVYTAERPELFFKATPDRVVHPGQSIRIRRDSTWDVPEPELALVVNCTGQIVGYTAGNDVSSRSIEGENPLYLPQAKVYKGCCSIGPVITLAGEGGIEYPRELSIRLRIYRGNDIGFEGEISTSKMRREPQELVEFLFREDDFPNGAILLTGTGIVPPDEFTLQSGDVVEIEIEKIGKLVNPVA